MSRWVGDLLVCFDGRPDARRSRSGEPWQLEHGTDAAGLWAQAPSEGWRGFPLATAAEGSWRIWVVGEAVGTTAAEIARRPGPVNGHALVIGHDQATRTWHLWTNRLGTLHGYAGPRRAGTHHRAVAEHSARRLDWTGIAGFLRLGFFPGRHTQYEDVRIVPGATHLVLDERGARVSEQRTWQWHHEPRRVSTARAAGEFREVFRDVVRDHTREGRVALPLSGGLDSRTAAAMLGADARKRVWSYSYGYEADSVELGISRRIARARGLDFDAIVIGEYLFDELATIDRALEGFGDVTQCRQAAMYRQLAARADFVVGNHMGDLWMDTMGASALDGDELRAHALTKLTRPGSQWLVQHLRAPAAAGVAEAEAEVGAALAGLGHLEDPDFRLKAMKVEQYVFRWTNAALRMYQAGAFQRLPFYDDRVVDFFCGLATDVVAGRVVQIEAIKQESPSLAFIPWQTYDANLYWYKLAPMLLLPKRAVNRVRRMVGGREPRRRNWEVQLLGPRGRERMEQHLTRPGLRLHEAFEPRDVAALVDEFHRNPTRERGYPLSMLLTVSAWLESSAS